MGTNEYDNINRQHKDTLFTFIFGREENKAWTLALYNAINETSYSNPDDIQITTIENFLYMGMKNDVSCLIGNQMNLYEHMSTINPNMPIRCLMYTGMLYNKYIQDTRNGIVVYSRKQQILPAPRCFGFYNGLEDAPDRAVLTLQDAFPPGTVSDIDVRVTIFNINHERNRALLEKCRPLDEYALLIRRIRENMATFDSREEAVSAAINSLPEDSELKRVLMANRAEVTSICLAEFDEEAYREDLRRVSKEEGRIEGYTQGEAEGLGHGLKALVLTLRDFIPDQRQLLDRIRQNPGYENTTQEEIDAILHS